eukprot:gene4296-biopygen5254
MPSLRRFWLCVLCSAVSSVVSVAPIHPPPPALCPDNTTWCPSGNTCCPSDDSTYACLINVTSFSSFAGPGICCDAHTGCAQGYACAAEGCTATDTTAHPILRRTARYLPPPPG